MPEGPHYYPDGVVTDQPEAFLAAELLREQLLAVTHDELPHSIAVTTEEVEERDDRRTGRCSRCALVVRVERDSQKGIVIGRGGVGARRPRAPRPASSSRRCSACGCTSRPTCEVDPDWQRRAALARPPRALSRLACDHAACHHRARSECTELRSGESAAVESPRPTLPHETRRRERLMLDRTHRLRRGGSDRRRHGDRRRRARELRRQTGPDNKQNALRPAGPYAHEDPRPDRRRSSGSRSSSASAWSAATIYVALRFREKPGEERSPKQMHGNTVLEVSWTIIPFADPRGDGGAHGRDDLRPRQEARRARRRARRRSPAGSGGGSTRTPTRTTVLHRQRDAHPGRPAGVLAANARPTPATNGSSTRSGSRS